MKWLLPGTVLEIQKEDADHVEDIFSSMFMAGGMVLGQVSSVTGLEFYTIQNWVKRGFLPPPQHRRYSLGQLCRIIHINMLKNVLSLETICSLLEYINGKLDEEADDIIDDATLYFLFVRLAARAKQLDDPQACENALRAALADYREPVAGAKVRVEKALRIMLTAWVAAKMQNAAVSMLKELKEETTNQ